jgi:hypothetical protein
MVKADELRIGNYVWHDGKVIIVDGIDNANDCIMVADRHIPIPCDEIDSVPVTKQCLKAYGFTKNEEHGFWFRNKLVIWYDDSDAPGIVGDFRFEFGNELLIIEHVHRLQNLYHSIYSEELTIKETI